jgi:hypothetical protein
MHLLQPQLEVTTSSLVSTHSIISSLIPDQVQRSSWQKLTTEPEQVDWLILHFNHWFSHHNVTLVKGDFEPEYFPAIDQHLHESNLLMVFLIVPCMKLVIGDFR